MSTSGNGPREPRSGGEDAAFEAAWQEIVAHFDAHPTSHDAAAPPAVSSGEADPDTDPSSELTTDLTDPSPAHQDLDAPDREHDPGHSPDRDAFDDLIGGTRPRLSAGEPLTPASEGQEIDAEFEEQYGEQFDAQLAADLDDPALLRRDPLPAWSPDPAVESEDVGFRPPTPPLPRSTPERWAAWIALLGVPVLVVLCTVFSYTPTEMVRWVLGAAWLGAFAYLVATMDDRPRDPWDDGSRV